ncbi:MAG: hypothetical protein WC732_08445 [Candidatus Omnitrophota bacterium]
MGTFAVSRERVYGYAVVAAVGIPGVVLLPPDAYHFGVYSTKMGAEAEAKRRCTEQRTRGRGKITPDVIRNVAEPHRPAPYVQGFVLRGESPLWECVLCTETRVSAGQPLLCHNCLGCCTMHPANVGGAENRLRAELLRRNTKAIDGGSAAWAVVARSMEISRKFEDLRVKMDWLGRLGRWQHAMHTDAVVQCRRWFFSQAQQMMFGLQTQVSATDAVCDSVRSEPRFPRETDPFPGQPDDKAILGNVFRGTARSLVTLINVQIAEFDRIENDGTNYPILLLAQLCAWQPALRAISELTAQLAAQL